MKVFHDPTEMQRAALEARQAGRRLALTPTMGNLHAGHIALIHEAKKRADLTTVSLFVNPTQFGPGEDFDRYPRTPESDLAVCREEGADWLFAPTTEGMYGMAPSFSVEAGRWGEALCGKARRGHFRGVATVVLKLLNLCQPHVAVFGWKDAQQFLLLSRMVQELNVPVEMVGVETVREPDGLAMSSRNQYLSPEERRQAPALYEALCAARAAFASGAARTGADLTRIARDHVEARTNAPLEYVEAVGMGDLAPMGDIRAGETLLALAARFGRTRLIDNIRL